METRRPVAIGTTLLGLVAIGAAAGMYGGGEGVRFGSGPGPVGGGGNPGQTGLPGWVIESLFAGLLGLAALFVLVVVGYLLLVRRREGLSQIARFLAVSAAWAIGGAGLFFAAKALLVYFSTGPAEPPGGGSGPGGEAPPDSGSPGAAGGGETVPAIFITVAVLCLAAVLVFFMFRRESAETTIGGRGGTSEESTVAVESGDVTAAIDIEDVPTTNAVYRAWREMATSAVDAADSTATASEVASTAVRSGFDRDAVRTLTHLFEEVRYGGRPVTDERERRAESALAAIREGQE